MSHDEYIDLIKSCVVTSSGETKKDLEEFCQRCTYICNDSDGDQPFVKLREHMEELGTDSDSQDRMFYMALPPKAYVTVSKQLRKTCYSSNGTSRIVVSLMARVIQSTKKLIYDGCRSRNHLGEISRPLRACKRLCRRIGVRPRYFESIITWERKW